ncbi:MAG TPA: hypothetical protein VGP93_00400, partial [Polyangiaceae bacterium]|nr:hypothetical protein [Polyangiaceae bacterium]
MSSMRRASLWCLLVLGCGSTKTGISCGPGTVNMDGQCVAVAGGSTGSGGDAGAMTLGGGGGSGGNENSAGLGGSSAGGSAQGGGADTVCPNPTAITAEDALVEDFEAGAAQWFVAADDSGVVTGTAVNGGATESNAGEVAGSTAAAHLQGS